MKLSTKGRYGLKAMFDLALHDGKGPVSLASISERQGISMNYLEQLVSPLRKAGLLKSVRGAQGGYLLAKAPVDISVKEILELLEGPLAPASCVIEGDHSCDHSNLCVSRMIYDRIYESINQVVENISLQDMLDEQHKHLQHSISDMKKA
jgi:Rrf2 family protein